MGFVNLVMLVESCQNNGCRKIFAARFGSRLVSRDI